jgi:hypothetical protein
MKRVISCVLAALLVLSLAACNGGGKNTPPPGASGGIDLPEMNPPMPLPEYPIIDGSSSTETMDAAIRAYLTGGYFTDPHSQTYAALERLAPGSKDPADVLLSVKYYDYALRDVEKRGADLVITPIAKEGFVFLLHKDNPIDRLTQQQLRDIFSGKVTNWKQLGGKDEKIVPVHRNWDSGSHTAMLDFMGDTSLTALTEDDSVKVALSMGGMIETVWTTGSGAIGYNIYSWSLEQGMGFGMNNLKLVAVDGVKPSMETLSDNRYPLVVYSYSYYNKDNPKSRALTDWLLTAEGQSVIASAGYVGIFGDYVEGQPPDFNKDEYDSSAKLEEFYMWEGRLHLDDSALYNVERVTDKGQTETLAEGKGKDVTVLYLVYFMEHATGREYTRFIVLTREKGGVFEVINEGVYEV